MRLDMKVSAVSAVRLAAEYWRCGVCAGRATVKKEVK